MLLFTSFVKPYALTHAISVNWGTYNPGRFVKFTKSFTPSSCNVFPHLPLAFIHAPLSIVPLFPCMLASRTVLPFSHIELTFSKLMWRTRDSLNSVKLLPFQFQRALRKSL